MQKKKVNTLTKDLVRVVELAKLGAYEEADVEGFVNFMDIDPENVIGCAWWKYG